ncbi:MAG: (2Fe-2S)-binding protein [Arcobacteraceae bacterium]
MSRKFEQTYEVCSCSHVSLGEIIYSIEKKNANTLTRIQEFTDVGKYCKCCICQENDFGRVKKELYCQEILEKIMHKQKS